jgi:EAL domain-containing protein (putative c-di-GMP-specific phosphodiesterase class I)/ActR/RegA family two-component response regulator
MNSRLERPGTSRGRLLLVDDDEQLLRSMKRTLMAMGFEIDTAHNGRVATEKLDDNAYNCIVSDISMPEMTGIELLGAIREHDLDVPVVLVTGAPTIDTAVQALKFGAFNYLSKPVDFDELDKVLEKGIRLHRMALMKRAAMELISGSAPAGDRAGLKASLNRAIEKLWMAYQPIVAVQNQTVYGYEALLRSDEPSLGNPGAIIDAAERLGELQLLGRTIRDRATLPLAELNEDILLFVNLHPRDLLDPKLTHAESPLSQIASRVVLEITERSALDVIKDVRHRISALREMGFRIAIDDLGAGYAGLTSFATLEPEIVKLDMSLIRDVHKMPMKQKLIGSMTELCKDMGMLVVAEGIESVEERDTLINLGCDLLQGYFLAKPARPFPEVTWL